jgi:hypothetical protein
MILTAQLSMSIWITIGAHVIIGITIGALHLADPETAKGGDGPGLFVGAKSAHFVRVLLWSLAAINVLWGLRWFASPRVITTGLYGVPPGATNWLHACGQCDGVTSNLTEWTEKYDSAFDAGERRCGSLGGTPDSGGYMTNNDGKTRCASVISSFLAYPWALYCHITGALATVSLSRSLLRGPLPLPRHPPASPGSPGLGSRQNRRLVGFLSVSQAVYLILTACLKLKTVY